MAKNTRFDRWLKAVMENGRGEGANGQGRASQEEQRTARGDGDLAKLQEVAEYLQRGAGGRGGRARGTGRGLAPEQPGVVEDTKAFQPGWEDIFRMNQQQVRAGTRAPVSVLPAHLLLASSQSGSPGIPRKP